MTRRTSQPQAKRWGQTDDRHGFGTRTGAAASWTAAALCRCGIIGTRPESGKRLPQSKTSRTEAPFPIRTPPLLGDTRSVPRRQLELNRYNSNASCQFSRSLPIVGIQHSAWIRAEADELNSAARQAKAGMLRIIFRERMSAPIKTGRLRPRQFAEAIDCGAVKARNIAQWIRQSGGHQGGRPRKHMTPRRTATSVLSRLLPIK